MHKSILDAHKGSFFFVGVVVVVMFMNQTETETELSVDKTVLVRVVN